MAPADGAPLRDPDRERHAQGAEEETPWIIDRGETIADSEIIIATLKARYGVDPDAGLSDHERALGLAWTRTFEEHFHQAFEHELILGRGGSARHEEMTRPLPPVQRTILRASITSSLRKQLWARGLGRHDPTTILDMGRADLDAASAYLGEQPFFLGARPHTVDCSVFGFLGTTIYVKGDNPLFRHAASLPNLVAFTERMRARLYPETISTRAAS